MAENFPKLEEYVNTWYTHFPDWKIMFWSVDPIVELLRVLPDGERMVSAFKKLPNKGAQSDFARYAIVYVWGGMYVDTDMECLRNFSCLLTQPGKNLFLSLNEDFLAIEKAFAARSSNHWFYCPYPSYEGLWHLVVHIATVKTPAKPSIQWTLDVTGPTALSKMSAARNDVGYISWHLLEGKSLANCQKRYKNGEDFPCAFAVHHMGGTWLPKSYSAKLRSGIISMYGGVRHNSLILLIVSIVIIVGLLSIITWMAVRHRKLVKARGPVFK